jgi:hypothetical protein
LLALGFRAQQLVVPGRGIVNIAVLGGDIEVTHHRKRLVPLNL